MNRFKALVFALMTVFVASPAFAAVTEAPDATSTDVVAVAEDGEDDGLFLGQNWAPLTNSWHWSVPDDLHPTVQDNMVIYWIGSIFLPFGGWWLPYLLGDETPDEYFIPDHIVHSFLRYALFSMATLPLLFIPYIGWGILVVLTSVYGLATNYYLGPIGGLKSWSDSLYRKESGAAHPLDNEQPKARRKKRRARKKRSNDASLLPQHMNAVPAAF